jgi:hypothetical protein
VVKFTWGWGGSPLALLRKAFPLGLLLPIRHITPNSLAADKWSRSQYPRWLRTFTKSESMSGAALIYPKIVRLDITTFYLRSRASSVWLTWGSCRIFEADSALHLSAFAVSVQMGTGAFIVVSMRSFLCSWNGSTSYLCQNILLKFRCQATRWHQVWAFGNLS